MDLDSLPVDGEASRARLSEYVDMNLVHAGAKLREMGIEFDEKELAAVPPTLAERLLHHITVSADREAEIRAETVVQQAQLEHERGRLESLQEDTEKVRREVAMLSERISSALSNYRREDKLESQHRRERQRDIQNIVRQIEKHELELRRETMEHDRLSKILKKVTK